MSQNVEISRKEIGDRVRTHRLKHGWTDEELGQMIGLSGGTLNSKERGVRDFTWNEAVRLADVFGITLDELIRGVRPEHLAAHRKTGLSNDAVSSLKYFFENHSLKMLKGLNLALSSIWVLDALARYMSFTPGAKGYYLSELRSYKDEHLLDCRMSEALYFNVLGQNLLHMLNEARNKDHSVRKHYEAVDDFFVTAKEQDTKMAESSEYEQMDKDPDQP